MSESGFGDIWIFKILISFKSKYPANLDLDEFSLYLCISLTIQNFTAMEKMDKKQENQEFDPKTMFITSTGEIKKLSKYGIWRRQNPGGMLEYVDWDAVNRVNGRLR